MSSVIVLERRGMEENQIRREGIEERDRERARDAVSCSQSPPRSSSGRELNKATSNYRSRPKQTA